MSSYKAKRATFNRGLRVISQGLRAVPITTPQRHRIELDTFQAQQRYLRPELRFSWRARVARGFEGDRLGRLAVSIIEGYESYLLRKRHATAGQDNVTFYTLPKYIRQYERKTGVTPQVYQEVVAWYQAHGSERIGRMRKMHAIVGTEHRVILRTE